MQHRYLPCIMALIAVLMVFAWLNAGETKTDRNTTAISDNAECIDLLAAALPGFEATDAEAVQADSEYANTLESVMPGSDGGSQGALIVVVTNQPTTLDIITLTKTTESDGGPTGSTRKLAAVSRSSQFSTPQFADTFPPIDTTVPAKITDRQPPTV